MPRQPVGVGGLLPSLRRTLGSAGNETGWPPGDHRLKATDCGRVSTSSKPGGSTHATGGFGSSSHLAVALFSFISGAKFNHVPYKGAGPALADVVAGPSLHLRGAGHCWNGGPVGGAGQSILDVNRRQ
jgi:Tripartite tricarboxylate transporter family receptor